MTKTLNRREMMRLMGLSAAGTVLAACAPAPTAEVVEVEKQVVVTKEVETVVTAVPVMEDITMIVHSIERHEFIWDERVAEVQKKYPNVTFEKDEGAVSAEDEVRFLARLASGVVPDVTYMGDENPSFYGPRGIFVDLAPYMNADKDFWFNPSVFDQRAFNIEPYGAIYAIPFTADARQTMVNLQNFEDMGVDPPPMLYGDPTYDSRWSWEGMKETARQLTVDSSGNHPGDSGFDKDNVEKYGLTMDLNWHWLWPMIYQAGGKVVDDDWTRVFFDSDESIKAMKFVQGMVEEGMMPAPGLANQLGGGTSLIQNGVTAMNMNGIWTARSFREAAESGEFRLSFAPFAHDVKAATVVLGTQAGVPTLSKHPEIAYEWMKSFYIHLGTLIERFTAENPNDNPHNLYRIKVDVPLTEHFSCYGQDCVNLLPILEDAYKHAAIQPKPYGPWFPEVRDLFYSEMGPALNGDTTVEAAVEALMPQTQEVMDRWYEQLHG